MALTNSDIMRRLRYALRIDDALSLELMRLGGSSSGPAQLRAWMEREDSPTHVPCPTSELYAWLDGLVIQRRGPREGGMAGVEARPIIDPLRQNNEVLKKIKIALELKDDDLVTILARGGMEVGTSALSSFFRKPGHRNYKPCGDQLLRNLLGGLAGWQAAPSVEMEREGP